MFEKGDSILEDENTSLLRSRDELSRYPLECSITLEGDMTWLGLEYFFCIGMSAIGEVCLAINIDNFAYNVGYSTSFVRDAMNIGLALSAIFGSVVCPWLHGKFESKTILMASFFIFSAIFFYVSICESIAILLILFVICGLIIGIADTTAQIMTRKVHQHRAGPWLGANAVAYVIFGASAFVFNKISSRVYTQCLLTGMVSSLFMILIHIGPSPVDRPIGIAVDDEGGHNYMNKGHIRRSGTRRRNVLTTEAKLCASSILERLDEAEEADEQFEQTEIAVNIPHIYVELIIAVVLLCVIGCELILGGNCSTSAYLSKYIESNGAISSSSAQNLSFAYWLALLTSRIASIFIQIKISTPKLMTASCILLYIGAIAAGVMLVIPANGLCLWAGVIIVGLSYGAVPPFAMNLANRMTYPTSTSTTILMVGVNLGVVVVPYVMVLLWNYTPLGFYSMMLTLMVGLIIPVPLISIANQCRYIELSNYDMM